MGMDVMLDLRDMLCEELEELTKKGELSAGSLDVIDKLTHSIKSIDTIVAMEDSGYSREEGGNMGGGSMEGGRGSGGGRSRGYYQGGSYGGGSYARRGRDSRGRYTSRRGSRDGGREEMISELEEIMQDAQTERERQMIQNLVNQMRGM